MTLIFMTAACLTLAMSLWLVLRHDPHSAPHALPLTAVAIGLVVLGFDLWMEFYSPGTVLSPEVEDQVFHDTYHTVSHGRYLAQIGLGYLGVAVLLGAVQRLGRGWVVVAALPWAFWVFALGSLVIVLLPSFLPLPMPRRYVDYAEWGRVTNQISTPATWLAFLGGAAMVLTLAAAVIQRLLRSGR